MEKPKGRGRGRVAVPVRRMVKVSVPIDVETHAKLAAAAALEGRPAGAIVAEWVRANLSGLYLVDRRGRTGQVDPPADEGVAA